MIKIFRGWWIVLACFFISLYVGAVVFFGFTAFFKPLIKEFGWSYTQISFASSLRGLEMGIFAPLVGVLVDRFGSRKLIITGVLTTGIGLLLLSQTQTLLTFYASYLLLSFGAGGCTSVVSMVVVANWFEKNVGKAMGIMASGFGASGLLVPIIVLLIDTYTWRTALIFMGLGMWIVGLPLALIIRNKPEAYVEQLDSNELQKPIVHLNIDETISEIGIKKILRIPSFWYLNLIDFVRMMSISAIVLHIMPYLSGLGFSRTQAGYAAGAVPLISIIGRAGFGWLGDVYSKRLVMTLTYALMTIGIFIFCWVQIQWLVAIFLVFYSTGFGGSMVLRGTILREYYGTFSLGKLLGINMGIASVGGIIGPTIAGWAYDTIGSYLPIWFGLFVTMLLSAFLSLKIIPLSQRKQNSL